MPLQTDFSAGEIAPRLVGRTDVERYGAGLAKARNVALGKGGSLARRPGLRWFAETTAQRTSQAPRLLAWSARTADLLVELCNDSIVLRTAATGAVVATLAGPSGLAAALDTVQWAADETRLILAHPSFAPWVVEQRDLWILGGSVPTFFAAAISWFKDTSNIEWLPAVKWAAAEVTLTASATTGTVTLTASANHFTGDMVGDRIIWGSTTFGQLTITAVASATSATATVDVALPAATATRDWRQQIYSAARGWPGTLGYHQGRLVLGGNDLLSNHLVASASGDHRNYKTGVADADAFVFAISADEGARIRHLRSQGPLIVWTSGSEHIVPEMPMTPTSFSVQRQSSQGADPSVRPVELAGAAIFLRRWEGKPALISFAWSDVAQAYVPSDISLLGQHLIGAVREMVAAKALGAEAQQAVHLVGDGVVTVLHLPDPQRPGFTRWEASGVTLEAGAVTPSRTWLAGRFNGRDCLLWLDDAAHLDASLAFTLGAPATTLTGLSHLEGLAVVVKADGKRLPGTFTVAGGQVTLPQAVTAGEVGLPIAWEATTLPLEPVPPATTGRLKRAAWAAVQLQDSHGVALDGRPVTPATDQPAALSTGSFDRYLAGGWTTAPAVALAGDEPWPFTLLSLSTRVVT